MATPGRIERIGVLGDIHGHRRLIWSYRRIAVVNAGTLYREHEPCFMLVDLVEREVTWFDLGVDNRIVGREKRPIPPPYRVARRD